MVFEIEFTTTDVRPLFPGRDKNLIGFLEPLHKNNKTIFSYGKSSYLRQLGPVKTIKKNGKAFFNLQNGVKFPNFNIHRVDVEKSNLSYIRKNHLRRFMTTDTYGVINRFKFGFEFELKKSDSDSSSQTSNKPILKSDKHSLDSKISSNDIRWLVNNLLHIQTKVGKKHSQELPIFKLGKWMAEAIERNTQLDDEDKSVDQVKSVDRNKLTDKVKSADKDKSANEDKSVDQVKGSFSDWLKKKAFRLISEKNRHQNDVEHVDTVVALSFNSDENVEIPDSGKRIFIVPSYIENQHKKDIASNDSNESNTLNVTNATNDGNEINNNNESNQPNKEDNTTRNNGNQDSKTSKENTNLNNEKDKEEINYKSKKMLEIYYYDYPAADRTLKKDSKISETVRVYFIKKHPMCNPRYYHSVVNRLLDLRANLVCLENVVSKIRLTTYKQDCFITSMLDKIREIKKGDLGFLNLTDSDKGEVMDYSRRKNIRDKIRMYRYLVLR